MEQTDLRLWLKDTTGFGGEEIPQELYPVFQSLQKTIVESERKVRALLKQKQLFTLLVNGTVDMFMMFSAKDFTVDYVSPNMEYLLGLRLEDVRKDIRQFLYTSMDQEYGEALEKIMKIPLGGSIQFLNEHIHQRTKEHRWYQKTIYHFFLNNDHKYIMVISDRTAEIEMQRQLEISIEMTKSANEAKSSFLANMSHDIRTPMNAIVGFSTLLKHDAENPVKVREYARKISSSSQHLLNLINDILDMSKIESGKATLNTGEFGLSELLEDIAIVINPQARGKGQEFEIRTQNIQCEQVLGDKTRINQILLNLLSNSVKYTPEGGRIQLLLAQEVQADSKYVNLCFQVIDNGMGMSPEYLEVIFDAFTREESAAIKGIQGTGLGMAITKNLVELMGGTIAVESEKGVGTTFTVNLKLQGAAVETDREFWAANGIRKILVVDHDEAVCADIKRVMDQSGVVVAYTTSGEQGIDFVLGSVRVEQPYDLVLVDWKMPGRNGVELTRHIREALGDRTPVMILSAYDWSEIEEVALAAGVKGFLQKPFFLSNFRALIRQLNHQEEEDQQDVDGSLSGLRFLAAEDNEINAEILKELLQLEGACCDTAENGQAAVDMFCASAPGYYDIILMDVQMPVMDGYTATKAIRACDHPEGKTIPIAAMTANAFEEDVQLSLNAGMDAHIAKPVDMNLLKGTVLELLRRQDVSTEVES